MTELRDKSSFFELLKNNPGEVLPALEEIWSHCDYHTLPSTLGLGDEFKILHINARSIKNKFDEFQNFINMSGINWSAICVCETWLKLDLEQFFEMDNFHLFATSRNMGEGGGTALYINKKYDVSERRDLESDELESTFVEINLMSPRRRKSILLGNIYRPPNFSNITFNDYLEKVLDTVEQDNKLTIFTGDFNYDLLNTSKDKYALSFANLFSSYGFFPMICKPTRIQGQTSSLLDNIFINDSSVVCSSGIINDDLSDHLPIYFSFSFQDNSVLTRPVKQVFDKTKVNEFNRFLEIRLANFQIHQDANSACDQLIEAYQSGLSKFSKQFKPSRRKTPIKPWVTPAILCSINRKK